MTSVTISFNDTIEDIQKLQNAFNKTNDIAEAHAILSTIKEVLQNAVDSCDTAKNIGLGGNKVLTKYILQKYPSKKNIKKWCYEKTFKLGEIVIVNTGGKDSIAIIDYPLHNVHGYYWKEQNCYLCRCTDDISRTIVGGSTVGYHENCLIENAQYIPSENIFHIIDGVKHD